MLTLGTYSSGQIIYCALVFSLFRLRTLDGNWTLCFPHCMFPVSSSVPNLPKVRFPNVCPEPLKPKSAFCIEHYSKAQTLGYPIDVKGFLAYCGAAKTAGISLLFRFEDYGLYPGKRDSKISCP